MKKYGSVFAAILCVYSATAFADDANIRHFENGKPTTRLENGDVIQEIDGQKVDSPQKAFELMRKPKTAKQLKIKHSDTKVAPEQAQAQAQAQ